MKCLKFFTVGCGLLYIKLLAAQPIEIKDYGNTRSSGLFTESGLKKMAVDINATRHVNNDYMPYQFPTTSKMTFGKLNASIKHDKFGVNPFFIIGGEKASLKWLKKNKKALIEKGIRRGFMTNIKDLASFHYFIEAAKPIQLYVMDTDEIGKAFNVNIYPIVITNEEIQQ